MNIFSFCLYGTDLKYYLGLRENLKLINAYFPTYLIYLYVGNIARDDYIKEYQTQFNNVCVIYTYKNGAVNMLYRYKPLVLAGINSVIIRDADSEVNERDRYCINDFINNDDSHFVCQVIRDNFWHKSKITGGLSFFKNIQEFTKHNLTIIQLEFNKLFADIEQTYSVDDDKYIYGTDENTLNEKIYPHIKNHILVYTNISAFQGEKYKFIDFTNTGTNFCGNVNDYIQTATTDNVMSYIKTSKFNYFKFNIVEQLHWLSMQAQYDLILKVVADYGLNNCAYEIQAKVLDYCFIAHYYNKDLSCCMAICKQFYKYEITPQLKQNFNFFYHLARALNYKIIGTCDVTYTPNVDEIVIYYGNYPDDYMALPQSNRIYKHILYKDDIQVDCFKYDACWQKIDKIFIMSLETEFERTNDTILQLALMHAPLNRIHVYRAKKDQELDDIYIGVTKNHIECLKLMLDAGYETCLFLEDDFIFTSSVADNKQKLLMFLERRYMFSCSFKISSARRF